jgi:hypothetical protein
MYHVPVLMTADVWFNSQMSIARFNGGIRINGVSYIVYGEFNDLLDERFVPLYKRLGRKQFIALLKQHPNIDSPKDLKKYLPQPTTAQAAPTLL